MRDLLRPVQSTNNETRDGLASSDLNSSNPDQASGKDSDDVLRKLDREESAVRMATPRATASNVLGVISMLAAVATFAVMDVSIKRLVESYPPIQVTFLRGIASLPLLFAATGLFAGWGDLLPRRWALHVVRGLIGVLVLWLFVYAVERLSLSDAYAIFMSAPLLITALSVPMLREQVGWRRWLAVLMGLIGVLIILNPSGSAWISIGGLAALCAAVGYTINAITIRILSHSDTAAATIIWPLMILTAISGALALPVWTPLSSEHGWWIVLMGVSGALAQHFMTYAFRCSAPATLAPLEYTALAWAMLFDYVLWATSPNLRMLCGATIIVASGLYVFHRERRS